MGGQAGFQTFSTLLSKLKRNGYFIIVFKPTFDLATLLSITLIKNTDSVLSIIPNSLVVLSEMKTHSTMSHSSPAYVRNLQPWRLAPYR